MLGKEKNSISNKVSGTKRRKREKRKKKKRENEVKELKRPEIAVKGRIKRSVIVANETGRTKCKIALHMDQPTVQILRFAGAVVLPLDQCETVSNLPPFAEPMNDKMQQRAKRAIPAGKEKQFPKAMKPPNTPSAPDLTNKRHYSVERGKTIGNEKKKR